MRRSAIVWRRGCRVLNEVILRVIAWWKWKNCIDKNPSKYEGNNEKHRRLQALWRNTRDTVLINDVKLIKHFGASDPKKTKKDGSDPDGMKLTDKVQALCAILIFLVTFAYTICTYFQWKTADKTLTQMQSDSHSGDEHYFADERPQVWVMAAGDAVPQPQATSLFIRLYVANYGKTPALKAKIEVIPLRPIGDKKSNDIALTQDAFIALMDPQNIAKATNIGVIPPGIPPDGNITKSWFSGNFNVTDTPGNIAEWAKIDGGMAVVGSLHYSDIAKKDYWSFFCYYRLKSGSCAECDYGNNMQ